MNREKETMCMKKLLSILLGVAMLLALVPASVFAEGYAVKIGE